MTSMFHTRRRVEEFARAVDAPGPVREVTPDLEPLLALAGALRSEAPVAPRADFAADLRARLMAEAEQVLEPGAVLTLPVRRRPRERRLAAAASVVVVLGSGAGVAAAAQSALPGDALYPVKRGIEQAQAGLSVSSAGRGRDLLHQAGDRLTEVQGLLAADDPTTVPQVPGTLADFTAQAREGADLLLGSYQDTRDPADIAAVREFAADGAATLEKLAAAAPPDSQDELAEAALTLGDIDAEARSLCVTCTDLPDLQVPALFLAAADVDRTLGRLAAGGAAGLDNSHPVVVDRAGTPRVTDATRGGKASGGSGGTTTDGGAPTDVLTGGSGGGSTGGGTSDPTGTLSGAVDDTVDQVQEGVGGAAGQVENGVGDTVAGVVDGLSDATETLLPDPDPSTGGTGGLLP